MLGNFTGWAVSLAVALYGMSVIGTQPFGWATLAIQLLFMAGWGYYAFIRAGALGPAASQPAVR